MPWCRQCTFLQTTVNGLPRHLLFDRAFIRPACAESASTVLIGFGSVDTSRTSSLLFSERTAAAVQRGVAQELIAQSHASRLIST